MDTCTECGRAVAPLDQRTDYCTCAPAPECMEGPEGCEGEVEYRMALSPSGRSFPRCDAHWAKRLDEQERINRLYPAMQPSDFDPAYAGERWDED